MKTPHPVHHTRSAGITILEVLVIIIVVVAIVFFSLPMFSSTAPKGRMTDSLSNAKQIGTALKMYAGDNDGRFPIVRVDSTPRRPSDTSNRALENLMPKFAASKKIFFTTKSAWCRKPVEDSAADAYLLNRGQNDWNYVAGLKEEYNALWPLVANGTVSATDLTYSEDTDAKGGVWGGTDAIIVYVDGSARIKRCDGSVQVAGKTQTFVKRPDTEANILTVTPDWLGPGSFVLAPE